MQAQSLRRGALPRFAAVRRAAREKVECPLFFPFLPFLLFKLERFHGSIKGECIRPGTPMSLEDAVRIVGRYVDHYNQVRLHSAIGYVAPADKLAGREAEIFAARDRKLAEARERRKAQREATRLQAVA